MPCCSLLPTPRHAALLLHLQYTFQVSCRKSLLPGVAVPAPSLSDLLLGWPTLEEARSWHLYFSARIEALRSRRASGNQPGLSLSMVAAPPPSPSQVRVRGCCAARGAGGRAGLVVVGRRGGWGLAGRWT